MDALDGVEHTSDNVTICRCDGDDGAERAGEGVQKSVLHVSICRVVLRWGEHRLDMRLAHCAGCGVVLDRAVLCCSV